MDHAAFRANQIAAIFYHPHTAGQLIVDVDDHVSRIQIESKAALKPGSVLLGICSITSFKSPQPEIQQNFNVYTKELQAIAAKIGELEGEADEHAYAAMIFL